MSSSAGAQDRGDPTHLPEGTMSKKTQKTLYYTLNFLTLILAFVVITWLAGRATLGRTGEGSFLEGITSSENDPSVRTTMAVQGLNNRHLSDPDIAGTAAGPVDDARPAVMIFVKQNPGPAGR